MSLKQSIYTLVATVGALLLGLEEAQAYLDPSTGSMVISAIVGLFASVALAVKTYWYRLKSLFRRGEAGDTGEDAES
jgi:hypothetical protein